MLLLLRAVLSSGPCCHLEKQSFPTHSPRLHIHSRSRSPGHPYIVTEKATVTSMTTATKTARVAATTTAEATAMGMATSVDTSANHRPVAFDAAALVWERIGTGGM